MSGLLLAVFNVYVSNKWKIHEKSIFTVIDYSSSTLLLLEFSSIVEVCRIFLFFALFLQFGLDKQLCQNDVETVR